MVARALRPRTRLKGSRRQIPYPCTRGGDQVHAPPFPALPHHLVGPCEPQRCHALRSRSRRFLGSKTDCMLGLPQRRRRNQPGGLRACRRRLAQRRISMAIRTPLHPCGRDPHPLYDRQEVQKNGGLHHVPHSPRPPRPPRQRNPRRLQTNGAPSKPRMARRLHVPAWLRSTRTARGNRGLLRLHSAQAPPGHSSAPRHMAARHH